MICGDRATCYGLSAATMHMAKNWEPPLSVAERGAGAVDLVLTGLAPHLQRSFGEAQPPTC